MLNIILLWSADPSTSIERRLQTCLMNGEQEVENCVVMLVDNKGDLGDCFSIFSSLQCRSVRLVPG